jgi:putative FmdB family regulatory protein
VPIYDYLCSSCREVAEVIHGIDAPGPRFCPACGAEGTLRKAFAPPTVHFKGSGWAKKDRSSASRTRARPAGEGATGDAPATGGKPADGVAAGTGPSDSGPSGSSSAPAPDSGKGSSAGTRSSGSAGTTGAAGSVEG